MNEKIAKIDYIIEESDSFKVIFRFYPQESSCHGFGDVPPTNWRNVYKVYFHYEIIEENLAFGESKVVFSSCHDENSIMKSIAKVMSAISNNEKEACKYLGEIYWALGGVGWKIDEISSKLNQYRITLINDEDEKYELYCNNLELGYFADYLDKCCEYMLAHGDPI